MPTREELKSLIDHMPEAKLELVQVTLESILNPPRLDPQIEKLQEKMQRHSEEFREQLPERLKQLQAGNSPEIPRGFGFGTGTDFCYSWQENQVLVMHKSQLYGEHLIDIVDRLEMSDDQSTLIYDQEIYAGGRSVKRREEFRMAEAK